jgi:pimeloyl-ACP methyl ester carboxylesterase
LSIAANGRMLAAHMQRLVDTWPVPIERLVLLGHSMGGLVARSALHQAGLDTREGLRWPALVGDLVCLGSPHHGAPLERAGHGIDLLLGAAPYAAPLARLGKVRSAGITDLRRGRIVGDPAGAAQQRGVSPVTLPAGVRCYAVAASLGRSRGHLKARLWGDGLVPVDSALGHHRDPGRRLAFDAQRQVMVDETGHLDLLSSAEVYAHLKRWLA